VKARNVGVKARAKTERAKQEYLEMWCGGMVRCVKVPRKSELSTSLGGQNVLEPLGSMARSYATLRATVSV